MELNLTKIKICIDKFNKDSIPNGVLMNSTQMLYHCNTFIEVSIGIK